MAKLNGFMWVQPQIVGSLDDWGYSYTPGYKTHPSPRAAYKDGVKQLGHDDFIVAEWAEDKVVAIYAGPNKSDKRDDLLEDYGPGIMAEFGVAA